VTAAEASATGPGAGDQATRSDELAPALRLAIMRTARRLRSQRADTQLTLSLLSALGTVAKFGPMSAGDVATIERVQPPSMTKILASLQGMSLITREVPASDRRQSVITATEAGIALVIEESRSRDAWLAGRLTELSEADAALLPEIIRVLDHLGTE
jgi:DNA-binding MarR family transcriptional regulator